MASADKQTTTSSSIQVTLHKDDERAYVNPFPEYKEAMRLGPSVTLIDTITQHTTPIKHTITSAFIARIKEFIINELTKLESKYNPLQDENWTIYTGSSGIAYLYLHLANTLYSNNAEKQNECYTKAEAILYRVETQFEKEVVTFLIGDVGPITLLIMRDNARGDAKTLANHTTQLCNIYDKMELDKKKYPEELLYGLVGYLFALLLIKKCVATANIPDKLITNVVQILVKSGKSVATQIGIESPLFYYFKGIDYLGAAHGIAGIIYFLYKIPGLTAELRSELDLCCDYMITQILPSGNTPSTADNGVDKLVHWCHGAPGITYLYCSAFSHSRNSKYLKAAQTCAQVVWRRGILRKGHNLCHGVSGNAYALLELYKATNDPCYLYQTLKFAQWCIDTAETTRGHPDTPHSLFEGMAGVIYFMADLLNLDNAAFPGFQV